MRTLLTLLGTLSTLLLPAQTQVKITNVVIVDGDRTVQGNDQLFSLNNAEGADHVVLYDADGYLLKCWFKVSTHDSPRSSVKDSAVNLIMQLRLFIGDKKQDQRRVEKIFYGDQSRKASYSEKFNMKKGINVRTITVTFDAEVL